MTPLRGYDLMILEGHAMKLDFDEWKRRVNLAVLQLCGMECDDLPDFDYQRAYEAGWAILAVARMVVKHSRTF